MQTYPPKHKHATDTNKSAFLLGHPLMMDFHIESSSTVGFHVKHSQLGHSAEPFSAAQLNKSE